MAYYLKIDEGFSLCAFFFHNKTSKIGQIIRETFFSFKGFYNKEKEITLIKMDKKSSIENIIKKFNAGEYEEKHTFLYRHGTKGKLQINKFYSIQFNSDILKEDLVYMYCPTLFLS